MGVLCQRRICANYMYIYLEADMGFDVSCGE